MIRYEFVCKPGKDRLLEIMSLYRVAGWWRKGDNLRLLQRIVVGSHCFLVAMDGRRVVGIGRAVSDRANDAYIQDIVVAPSYRGRRIASAIILRLVRRLRADKLHWIGLIAAGQTRPLYEALGFERMRRSDPMLMER